MQVNFQNVLQLKMSVDLILSERIKEQGLKPLKDILRKMGGWPVLDGAAWNTSAFQWNHNIYINRDLGYSIDYIVDFSVTTNIKNSTWRIIDVSGIQFWYVFLIERSNMQLHNFNHNIFLISRLFFCYK